MRLILYWPLAFLALASAQGNLTISKGSKTYTYYGCFNETTQIPGSAGTRALDGGINEVKQGAMTVPLCLAFCANGDTRYRYAGLEWSRECWCAQSISGISEKLDDAACDYACEGDASTACGGALKLSVYRVSTANALMPSCFPLLLSIAFLLV